MRGFTFSFSRFLSLVVIGLSQVACSPTKTTTSDEQIQARATAIQSAGEHTLDVGTDGSLLVARALPSLPDSDEPLRLELRVLRPDGRSLALAGTAQDGRFLPGSSALVVVQSSGALLLYPRVEEAPRLLDEASHGPLAVAPGRVVYARGEMPDQELFSWEQAADRSRSLTEQMAPVWSPALSEDGQSVAFVSAQSGFPEVYELRGATLRKVTDRAGDPSVPFPSSPRGPRLSAGVLYFEGDEAVQGLALSDGRRVWSSPGRGAPLVLRKGVLMLAREHQAEVVRLDGGQR